MNICVCIKQGPDTNRIKIDPVTNTLVRKGVPSIINPFDTYAVEMAANLKERFGGTVIVMSMGPEQALGALRVCLSVGADEAYLISDRAFGGSDTLATGYIIAGAIRHIEKLEGIKFDVIMCGKQAIDGDTAQVGPQVAQKLGLNQVTYAEEILGIENGVATIRRHIDGGVETVTVPLPVLITVNGSAAPCRPQNAKLVMKYKYATCPMERPEDDPRADLYAGRPYLTLNQWSVADVDGDPAQCGLAGSPTKVKTVQNIVFQAKESKTLTAADADVEGLIKELLDEKIIG